MDNPKVVELRRSRNFGDILNVTFEFLRQNIRQLTKAILFISGPPMLVAAAIFGTSFGSLLGSFGGYDAPYGSIGALFLGLGVFMIAAMLMYAVVNEYVVLYAARGQPVEVSEVWMAIRQDFMMILVTSIGSIIIVALGFVLLIIPGIWLATVLSIILMVRIEERLDFGQAISRCFELVRGNWWFTFGVSMVMGIIAGFVGYVFQIPLLILTGVSGFVAADSVALLTIAIVIATMVGVIGRLMVNSLQTLAVAIQYYNLAERYDGLGLITRIESIGSPAPVGNQDLSSNGADRGIHQERDGLAR